eukprot:g6053.t1 g6053   contig20:696970-697845(+)
MATSVLLAAFSMLFSYHGCEAFVPLFLQRVGLSSDELCGVRSTHLAAEDSAKNRFLESLDNQYDLNQSSVLRTQLLNDLIVDGNGLANPASNAAFAPVASGVWRVVYAPHITTIAGLFGGEFSVQYDLREDGTMTSHARYSFPIFNLFGYLSVSGTYGSVNNNVCRVDFDEAWIKVLDNDSFEQGPFPNIESVQDSLAKTIIRNVGRAAFIEPFAVFSCFVFGCRRLDCVQL